MLTTKLLCSTLVFLAIASGGATARTPKPSARIPTVKFCDLASRPQKYLNRLVRTEASYVTWWESSYLYSSSCKDDEHKITNAPDCEESDEKCLARFALQWKKLKPYLRSKEKSKKNPARVKAVFIGRLFGPGEFGHLGSFKYEFRIKAVERASAIPRNISWKGL